MLTISVVGLSTVIGCKEPISIQPSCPAKLTVGESGQLLSGVKNPGEIATYQWQVLPSSGGEFDDARIPDPTFTAKEPGLTFLRLTASDGLWQVISECTTQIVESTEILIQLDAEPTTAEAADLVTLTCSDAGGVEVVDFDISQIEGAPVELEKTKVDGVVDFEAPEQPGDLEFRCIGVDEEGNKSDPAGVTVTVVEIAEVAVDFDADPQVAGPGDVVTLTCSDVGEAEVVEFVVTQTQGLLVKLEETDFGVFDFEAPGKIGDLGFECVGADEAGHQSDPATVTVSVVDVVVDLEADPPTARLREVVTLTCSDIGGSEVVEFSLTRTQGKKVELEETGFGVFDFEAPRKIGDLGFECVGADEAGRKSDPATVTVSVVDVVVDFEADPRSAAPGDAVILTCSDVGATEVLEFLISQTKGEEVKLEQTAVGVVNFKAPDETGDLGFQCVGTDEDGNVSDPATLTVTVEEIE